MNILKRTIIMCGLMIGASPLLAQTVTIAPPPGSVAPGQVVVVPVNFTSGGTAIGGLTVDVVVSTTQFSNVAISCAGQATGAALAICNTPDGAAGGKMRLNFAGDSVNPLATGFMGNLTLTVAPGAVPNAAQPIDGTVNGVGNVAGSDDLPLNTVTMVDGTLNIVGPAYSSNPAAGGGIEFIFGPVIQNAALASKDLVITNTGIGTLSGTCTETLDAGNVFTVTNGAYSAAAGLTDNVTLACNSAGAITTHTGQMSCTHNGGNVGTPVVYDMSCQITDGPKPAYSSNPLGGVTLDFGGTATEQGSTNPTDSIVVTNNGDAAGLTFSCTDSVDPSGAFTVTGGVVNAPGLGIGASSAPVVVTCDASLAPSTYTGTLSCGHNGSNATPVTYPLSCQISEAGAAIFASSPVPGPVDVTDGDDVVAGDPDPKTTLTFFNNAGEGDQLLDINCSLSGDSEITVLPDLSGSGISIAPTENSSVEFTCDSEFSGSFSSIYTCYYENGGIEAPAGELGTQVIYNVGCDVRDPESKVVPAPAPGTTLSGVLTPGGMASLFVTFNEVADEDLNATLISCSLLEGSENFAIVSPSFPIDIPAGGSIQVEVKGTDPGGVESISGLLSCSYTDSDNPKPTNVNYPLLLTVGGDARFTVLKDFTDGNPGEVIVDLSCNTGLVLDQEKTISEDGIGVTFVVTDFDAGELDCDVTERPVAGYSADYEASGDSASTDSDDAKNGCYFADVAGGDENACVITNSPKDVDVIIIKEWLYPGSSDGSIVSDDFEIVLYCRNAEIDGGVSIKGGIDLESPSGYQDSCAYGSGYNSPVGGSYDLFCKTLTGSGNTVFTEKVNPYDWPGGECYAIEKHVNEAVEVSNGCMGSGQGLYVLEVKAGSGDSCTITNTVFFEGIPTLSQYGMALLALLMLGMGFVAVRRIA